MKSLNASIGSLCSVLSLVLLSISGGFTLAQASTTFTPGEGGTLTFTEFQPLDGKVGGFQVYSSTRNNHWFGSGTYAEINMSFPEAAIYGADSLTLQCKEGNGAWSNFQYYGKDVSTAGNNFSVEVDRTYAFRLLLRGGPKSGYVSNEQTAVVSTVDTYFSQVTLDESMFLTGVMAPWVGRGLQSSFTVKKNIDNSEVDSGLTYQWYRVNPMTFERTLIPGADRLFYATTTADVGHKMLVVATGNQTTVGGFYQMLSGWEIVVPNKCYVSEPSSTGFILNLYQDVAKLDTGDLILRDKDYVQVPVTAVSKSKTNGIFAISATMSMDKSPYYLQNKSGFWKICTEMIFGQMVDMMEGVSIDLSANPVKELSTEPTLNMHYDASNMRVRFESTSMVHEVSMVGLTGALIGSWKFDQFEGDVPVGKAVPGTYVMRFQMSEGAVARKVMVTN